MVVMCFPRWSLIAGRMPGRTDNEIKNYWNTHLSRKLANREIEPATHKSLGELAEIFTQEKPLSIISNVKNTSQNYDMKQALCSNIEASMVSSIHSVLKKINKKSSQKRSVWKKKQVPIEEHISSGQSSSCESSCSGNLSSPDLLMAACCNNIPPPNCEQVKNLSFEVIACLHEDRSTGHVLLNVDDHVNSSKQWEESFNILSEGMENMIFGYLDTQQELFRCLDAEYNTDQDDQSYMETLSSTDAEDNTDQDDLWSIFCQIVRKTRLHRFFLLLARQSTQINIVISTGSNYVSLDSGLPGISCTFKSLPIFRHGY